MKLWRLSSPEDLEFDNGYGSTYPAVIARGYIVRAKDTNSARQLAAANEYDERCKDFWLNSEEVKFEEITAEGESELLLEREYWR